MDNQPIAHMTFEPDNVLHCMQDFSCFTGVPAGIRFAVYAVPGCEDRSRHKLIGPGYGEPGDYGNGAIYVFDELFGDAIDMASETVIQIITEHLISHGYDGLFNARNDCACVLDELEPCESIGGDCEPGYRVPCDCGDHDYHVQREKPTTGGGP